MGLAILPTTPKLGVYVFKQTGELVLLVGTWLYYLDVIYQPRQRKPKLARPDLMNAMEYVGEF